jgi:putative FmdB family regulatory protein
MPTYEYECTKCSHRFEEFQSITAEPLKKCPSCGGRIKRLIGAGVGVIFKGSGFYTTDYKRSSASSGATDPTNGKSKVGESSESSSKESSSGKSSSGESSDRKASSDSKGAEKTGNKSESGKGGKKN